MNIVINEDSNCLLIREHVFNKIKTFSDWQNKILNNTNIKDINIFTVEDIYIKYVAETEILLYLFKKDNLKNIIETPIIDIFTDIFI